MGCDIHGIVQVKQTWSEDFETIMTNLCGEHRSYDSFGVLAGVRNGTNFEPISTPKGLPNDFEYSEETNDKWLGDHSFSHLNFKEIKEYLPNVTKENPYLGYFFSIVEQLELVSKQYDLPPENIRIIFGFDS